MERCPFRIHDGSVDSFRNPILLGYVGDSGAIVHTMCVVHRLCCVREVLLCVVCVQYAWLAVPAIVEGCEHVVEAVCGLISCLEGVDYEVA